MPPRPGGLPVTDDLRIPLAVLRRRADPRLIRASVVLDDLRVGDVSVVDGRVVVDLEAEARGAEVVVTGGVRAGWSGDCRRCLEPVVGEVDLRVHEVMASDEPGRSAPEADDADAYQLGGDEADLEPVVRDAVLLALPLSPLCADDCVGPDPEWLPSADSPSETEDGPAGDPRWAALDVLRFDEPDLG